MASILKKSVLFILNLCVAAVAPVVATGRADCVWKRRSAVAIHIAFISLVLIGLVSTQVYFQLEAYVRSSLPFVRGLWLPIIGILGYATAWSAWFVARTLRQTDDRPLFDSVATALRDGLDRFTRAGIDPRQTPIYLVLGAPAGGIREFFASSHVELAVVPSAEEAGESVQVCGNRDAIYICCRDSSLTGHYAGKSAGSLRKAAAERRAVQQRSNNPKLSMNAVPAWRSGIGNSSTLTSAPSNPPAYQATIHSGSTDQLRGSASAVATLTPLASPTKLAISTDPTVQRIEQTLGQIESMTADQTPEQTCKTASILQPRQECPQEIRLDACDAEQLTVRLETICRQLVTLREPFCPINGVIALIPLPACDSVEASDHVGMRLERDLKTISDSSCTQLSMQVVYCDLDLCEGSQPFLDRFPENQRHRRLGVILPAVPESETGAVASSLENAAQWICNDLFSPLGFRLMNRDLKDATRDRELCMGNHRIQRLIQQMRDRNDGMSRMLRRAVVGLGSRIRIRGCFIAATGLDGHTSKQAFCEGVIPLILDMQNEVQWSRQRREQDRRQRAIAFGTYALMIGATIIVSTMMVASK